MLPNVALGASSFDFLLGWPSLLGNDSDELSMASLKARKNCWSRPPRPWHLPSCPAVPSAFPGTTPSHTFHGSFVPTSFPESPEGGRACKKESPWGTLSCSQEEGAVGTWWGFPRNRDRCSLSTFTVRLRMEGKNRLMRRQVGGQKGQGHPEERRQEVLALPHRRLHGCAVLEV